MTRVKDQKIASPPEYGNPPAHLLYAVLVRILQAAARLVFNARWHVDPAVYKLPGPLIVIANHPSYLDPFLAGCALYPIKVNFLAADNFFRKPPVRRLLRAIGAIPKIQFRPDPAAMKVMIRVLRRKGTLGIFPEGTRSVHGRRMPVEETFAKFIKRMGASVICVNSKGSYLTWPRWSASGTRKGRITVGVRILATAEEIRDIPVEELHRKILAGLDFDDYAMQKSEPRVYRSKAPAAGLHTILHQCPRCGSMWSMRSSGSSLSCSSCGNAAVMDRYGLLRPSDDSCKVFETVSGWYDWQLDCLKPLVLSPGFSLEDHTVILRSTKESLFEPAGSGVIRLTEEAFEFTPDAGSAMQDPLRFPIAGIWGISSDYGVFFDLFGETETYRFALDNGLKALTFSNALDFLRSKAAVPPSSGR